MWDEDEIPELEWIETEPGVWQVAAGVLRLEAREVESPDPRYRRFEGRATPDDYRNCWSSLRPVQCDLELHAQKANRNAGR